MAGGGTFQAPPGHDSCKMVRFWVLEKLVGPGKGIPAFAAADGKAVPSAALDEGFLELREIPGLSGSIGRHPAQSPKRPGKWGKNRVLGRKNDKNKRIFLTFLCKMAIILL